MSTLRSWLLLLIALLLAAPALQAEFIDFEGDVDPDTWTLLGTAEVQNGKLYLTQDIASQGGAIYWNAQVNDLSRMVATFDLIIESPSVTADGLCFCLSDTIDLGETGGQMGFTGPGRYGFEFDTYNNGFDPTFSDHIAVIADSAQNHLAWGDFFFNANQTYEVVVSIDDGRFEVKVDDQFLLSHTVVDFDPQQEVYLGVSASTGALSDAYVIDNLNLTATTSPIVLTLVGTTVVVPPNGGTVVFDAFIESGLPAPVMAQVWSMVTLPNGNQVGPVVSVNLPVIPGTDSYIGLPQQVPGFAPGGIYTYTAYLGENPEPVVTSDSFQFEKIGAVAGDGGSVVFPRPEWKGFGKGTDH